MLRPLNSLSLFLWICVSILFGQAHAQQPYKPRIVVTADPELDDLNSLIRLLLYSTDLHIEGLIYASSQFHWKGDGKGTKWHVPGREYDRFGMNACPCESWRWGENERFIHEVVEAYAKVYPNLKIHNKHYPTPDYLLSKIRYGNIEFDGDFSKDTPGSTLIKTLLLDNTPGPLFITAWGGGSTIARALKSIEDQYRYTTEWEAIRAKIARKVVLLPSGDQDDTFATYIRPVWPDIEIRQFTDSPNYGYGAQLRASEANQPLLTAAWMQTHISSKGALGRLYRVWGDGKQMVKGDKVDYFGLSGYTAEELKQMGYFVWMPPQEKGSWLGEGDNHTFMNMLGNGLRAYEKGPYGGWGGRVAAPTTHVVALGGAEGTAEQMAQQMVSRDRRQHEELLPFPDFFPQAQHSFAARMKWSVTPKFKDANHEPVVRLQGPLYLMANPGQVVKLHLSLSDPDGNEVSAKWFQLPAGSYGGGVKITQPDPHKAEVHIPKEATPGQTLHVVVEATDNGYPSLTSYQRVIIEVRNR